MIARHLLAIVFALSATPASAHHGWSGQEDKVIDLTGTVVEPVSLAGPHGSMKIRVGNDVWDITLAPSPRTAAAGLRANTIPVGATVTVRGNKSTEPGHLELKTIRVMHGGKTYNVYPDRQ